MDKLQRKVAVVYLYSCAMECCISIESGLNYHCLHGMAPFAELVTCGIRNSLRTFTEGTRDHGKQWSHYTQYKVLGQQEVMWCFQSLHYCIHGSHNVSSHNVYHKRCRVCRTQQVEGGVQGGGVGGVVGGSPALFHLLGSRDNVPTHSGDGLVSEPGKMVWLNNNWFY